MRTTLSALHHQASDWLRELDFYAGEINILQNRLKDYPVASLSASEQKQYDDFQKQLANLETAIAQLKHDVTVREGVIEIMTKENAGKADDINTPDDIILKQVKNLLHEISDTRLFFNLFLASLRKHQ